MRPRERQETGEQDLFRSRLDRIIDLTHALVKLSRAIDWRFLEAQFGSVYSDGPGCPPLPTRLMAGLALLKHMYDLSDEALCDRWIENPYFQFFCGEEFFQHRLPFDRSSLTRWRQRMGEAKLTALIQRNAAFQIDPVLWVREVLGVNPTAWQETFLRAQRGASILALTARQVGKTTTAAWAIAHAMLFMPGSLSVIACPAQRQSAEAVRRVQKSLSRWRQACERQCLCARTGQWLARAGIAGQRRLIRGLTVDAWIVADEAARLSEDIIAALAPNARPPSAGASGHALDGVEPH